MNEFDERVEFFISNLENILEFKSNEKGYLKSALVYVHEAVPTEMSIIFKKQDAIIASMEDVSYLIMRLKDSRKNVNNEYKKVRDPAYTSLVLKGRPSDTARDCEARTKVPELLDLESKLEILDYGIEYLMFVKDCLNKLYLDIRDRLALSKDIVKYG